MPGGNNLRGNVIRYYTPVDDDQGGAVPTGTVVYQDICGRISPLQPTLALLEQGLETPKIYGGILQYPAFNITGGFLVQENDVYEVTWPPINIHNGQKFRIIGVQYQSYDDLRKYLAVKLRRMEIANNNEYQ